MWGRIIEWHGGIPYQPPKSRRNEMSGWAPKPEQLKHKSWRKIMTPNPHYINMIINFSILGTLIYVAIQVS